jgi:uncharacterized cysteine cluster protein YcgN (CxxCxxCC family)
MWKHRPKLLTNRMDLSPFMDRINNETVCNRCGDCCHLAIQLPNGLIVSIPSLGCRFLRQEGISGLYSCEVYEERFVHEEARNWCSKGEDCIRQGLYPDHCPYVESIDGYQGRIRVSRQGENDLLQDLHSDVKPQGVSHTDWDRSKERLRRLAPSRST